MKSKELMKPIAYMLVGVPGSGKSTWMEPFLARDYKLVSTDDYIEKNAAARGQTYDEVFRQMIKPATAWMNNCAKAYTDACRQIIWDQTNLTPKSRRPKLDLLKAAGYEVIAVAFECPAKELERRRLLRAEQTGKSIPPSVLETMTAQYVRPTRLEGFDKVIIVTPEGESTV
jgi:predicted kinase